MIKQNSIFDFNGLKKYLFTALMLIAIFIATHAHASTVYIPADFPTIQEGIIAATELDTILVDTGVYVENVNYMGKNIILASKYLTTQDSSYIEQTIINGGAVTSAVKFENGEDSTAVICGFTITNGLGTGIPPFTGGGITCRNSSPRIMDMIIINNISYYGAGIYTENSAPTLDNVTLINNIASGSGGGGFFYDNSSPSLNNVNITINNADYSGEGLCCYSNSNPNLKNVIISNNDSEYHGGGLYCDIGSSPNLIHVTIVGNSAPSYGGAICCYDNSYPSLVNCIVSDNTGDYGIYVDAGTPTITYSSLYNNGIQNYYGDNDSLGINLTTNANGDSCDVYYNILMEPCFVDMINLNYHLVSNSPCIDAGDPNSPLDPDNTIADMGALYYDHDQAVDVEPYKVLENSFLLFPNPINSNNNMKLRFVLKNSGKVKMSLFNVKGQLIGNIINTELNQGEHTLNRNLKDLHAGMYFINMYFNGKSRGVQKMIMIK